MDTKSTLGYLAVFTSAFCFYMSTVVIKWSAMAGLHIRTSMFTVARFILGFIIVCIAIWLGGHKIRIVKKKFLVGKALLNILAVFCFFKAVALTSVAQANILNMTFPLFIALLPWIFFHEMQLPNSRELIYLFWCSTLAIAGQFLLTQGFRYVTAIEGGIIASTRIFLAALLGPVLVMDPALSFAGWIGAFLIFTGNVLLTVKKVRKFAGGPGNPS
ncbi:EamA family transporter [uncultured Desulfobacter sp.]|uniref:EamA family transporter n=1 Tax=uncultured Desulfobacter sp. TaxID=240139 RepID=UPI002AAB9138|nr:EamA family transporter [uncultured Desulfobacter sp.]